MELQGLLILLQTVLPVALKRTIRDAAVRNILKYGWIDGSMAVTWSKESDDHRFEEHERFMEKSKSRQSHDEGFLCGIVNLPVDAAAPPC
jgi:hypothetical protein